MLSVIINQQSVRYDTYTLSAGCVIPKMVPLLGPPGLELMTNLGNFHPDFTPLLYRWIVRSLLPRRAGYHFHPTRQERCNG